MREKDWEPLKSEWKASLEAVWRAVPKAYRNERSMKRTLQCHLFGQLKAMGFQVVADYYPPRIADHPVDLLALNDAEEIVYAVCFDSLVSLYAVKGLSSFDARRKVIFTTGPLEKKVEESRFFLKPGIDHVHLKPFD